jgi:hypothetical protein
MVSADTISVDKLVEAVDGLTVTPAVPVTATPPRVAEIVLASAMVEVKVAVATPLALVAPGAVKLLCEPVALRTTLAFWIGFPNWSFAVTVTSDAVLAPVEQPALQAVIVAGAAPTVDRLAETAVWAFTVTAGCAVIWVPLIVTVIVLASAFVEVKVEVLTPLALVVGGGVKLLLDPVALSATVAPAMGFPPASLAVTVMSEAVFAPVEQPALQAVIGVGAAPAVESVAEAVVEAFTVTLAVALISWPPSVAEIVFDSAVDEEKIEVATPLASVVPGAVKLLLEPVELRTTVVPGIGFPN